MPVITAPVDRALARSLRRTVLAYRSEPARPPPTLLHVGRPAGEHVRHAVRRDELLDAALRVDVVAALLVRMVERGGTGRPAVPMAWLARPGDLDWQDADAQWLASARAAYAEAGVPLAFVVVGRDGWVDPRSGVRVEWKRLRDRSRTGRG